MEKLIEAQRSMCYGVSEFFTQAPEGILVQLPTVEVVLNRFRTTLNFFPEQSESQAMDRRGQAILKDLYKRDMARIASNVSGRIKARAVVTGNVVLASEMSKSYSVLYKESDTVSADLCTFIHGKGEELLSSVEAYGVTTEMLDRLKGEIDLFVEQLPKPRAGVVERKLATKKIKVYMKSLLADLKVVDALVGMIRFDEEDFYDTYTSTRKVVGNGHRTLSIMGLVLDENGLPLEKVDVYLIDSDVTRKTSAFGGFEIKNLKNEVYKLRFVKPGYLDVIIDVPVTATMRSEVTVQMERTINDVMKAA